jgi:4-amino-4-deoxy-L-arabinose transferase-like glycosyltransferase
MGALARGRLLLVTLFVPSRLIALTVLPVFLDETLHVRWAREIAEGRRPWTRPWQWGRALTVWAGAVVTPFANDLVWANRAVSVAAGAIALWAIVETGRRLFDAQTGFLAGLLYVVCPFTLFYDRMALAEAALGACTAVTMLASVRILQDGGLAWAAVAAVAMACGVLTKAPGVLLFAIPVSVVLLPAFELRRIGPLALAYAVGAAPAAYALHGFFTTHNAERMVGIATENPAGPLARFLANVAEASSWLAACWTWPLMLLGIAGVADAVRRRDRRSLWLLLLAAGPTLLFAASLSRWLPRYLLFTSIPFLLLAGKGASRLLSLPRTLGAGLLALALVPALLFDVALWTDPARAPFVPIDREQYVTSWASGYGTRDTIALVRDELRQHPEGLRVVCHVNRYRTLRATPLALSVALAREPRLRLEDWDLADPSAIPALQAWTAEGPGLVVVPRADPAIPPPPLEPFRHLLSPLARTTKPDGALADEVYRFSREGAP